MENDTFGGAILAWVKSARRGAGIELPASLRHRLRQGQHRGTDGRMTPPFHLVGEESPCLQPRHAVASATPSPRGTPPKTPVKI